MLLDELETLPRPFYDREADVVARELLDTLLIHRRNGVIQVGRVVETEAYLGPHDLASHTSRGKTSRNAVMYGPPGFAYIYMIYGMYHCLNAVTGAEGHGAAVLIRALEPLEGIDQNASGPGRLCRALGLDRSSNGLDLTSGVLTFAMQEQRPRPRIAARPRIGVAYAGDWAEVPLRFCIAGHPCLSRP